VACQGLKLKIQAQEETIRRLQEQTMRAAAWPAAEDVPSERPALDQFISAGFKAMSCLDLAQDRRFRMEQTRRRQADAHIRKYVNK
jgi:hypothetical protein